MSLLEMSGVCSGYGHVGVLREVALAVEPGEIACLIGSNGAGKTTLLKTVSGVVRHTAGQISFLGRPIGQLPAQEIVKLGIAHVPEGRRLFAGMTVRENLLMGAYLRKDGWAAIARDLDFVLDTLPRLKERLSQDASTLSGGEQQMCAIGRGLMAKPLLLLVDELSLGLAPKIVSELSRALLEINKTGLSILLVEQDVATALRLAKHGFVLDTGRIVLSGTTAALANNPNIRQAYLGAVPAPVSTGGEAYDYSDRTL
jgi:branched-chain amino acid transport system ATP-binding protein